MKRFLPRSFRLNRVTLTFGCVAFVLAVYKIGVPIFDLVELKTYDMRFRVRGALQPADAVVLATIDEKSLDAEGRWPWPRTKIADLVDKLSRGGARVIVFDVAFPEPDENAQIAVIEDLAALVDALRIDDPRLADFIALRRERADTDRILAAALERSTAATVLGYFFQMTEVEAGTSITPQQIAERIDSIASSQYALILEREPGASLEDHLEPPYSLEVNLPSLARAADDSGYFSVQQDPDGIVRWVTLMIRHGEHVFPPLSILAAWHYLGKPQLMVDVGRGGVEGVRLGDRAIPTNEQGRMLVNYLGPPGTFRQISVTDILRGRIHPSAFEDKIVLVGATATATYDVRSTPFGVVFPGLEIHATAIDNILTGRFLTKPAWTRIYDVFAIIVLGLVAGLVLTRVGAVLGLAFTAVLFGLHIGIAQWLFSRYGFWLDLVYPLTALTVTWAASTVHSFLREQRERRKMRGAFDQYVAPAVIESMLKDPSRLELGGEQKVLTVLFSDLQGFTSYTERYGPKEMTSIMSEYYERMTEEIFAQEGMLKEYVGDELMAIFGAPLECEDHAERACRAALGMREARKRLSEEWAKVGRPPIIARTGVNTGSMLVGNLGSKYRFSYGVLGDQVNLGSRLEGINKQYGTAILIGEGTAESVRDSFRLREVDMVQVLGREKPARIYELLGDLETPLGADRERVLRAYAEGLEAYRAKRWDDALRVLDGARAEGAPDGPSQTLALRCRIYRASPPPEDWDGVFVATEK